MGDLIFSVVFIALIGISVVLTRSLARFAVLTLFSVSITGAVLQFLVSHTYVVTFGVARWWLLGAGVGLVILSAGFGRRGGAPSLWHRSSNWILIGSSLLITVAFLVSRLLAPGESSTLSSVGFFLEKTAAEDNAKWLNATSQLADGSIVDTWSSVGGPLILILTLAASLIGALSFLLYGGVNEVAVSAGSIIFTQVFLVIIAPFALAPIIERRFKKITGGKTLPWVYSLLSVTILSASTAVLITYGHITLQFTLLAITLWIASFLAPTQGIPSRLLTTLAVVATSMVWFPLAGLAAGILVAILIYFSFHLIRGSARNRRHALYGLFISIAMSVIMVEFLRSSLSYSLGISGATASGEIGGGAAGAITATVRGITSPTLPLFDDPGGTEVMTTLLLALTLVSILGMVWVRVGKNKLNRNQLITLSPIIASGSYALLIAVADFWAVGSGPNYGSLKISFAVFMPILVASLPFALMAFHRGASRPNALGLTAVAGIVVVLTLDTLFPRAVLQLKPANWPNVSSKPYWYPAEVRDTGEQSLASNPIGCVFLPRGAEQPTALPQGQLIYTCTRLLSGVAGVETLAAPIVKWQLDEWLQNRSMWNEMHPYFSSLDPAILGRSLILLDQDRQVVGLETIGGLLRRYQPVETQ